MAKRKSRKKRPPRPPPPPLHLPGRGLLHTEGGMVYLNAWGSTLLLPILAVVLGLALGFTLVVLCLWAFDFEQALLLWPLFTLYWLWRTESWWFGLTCRRFAKTEHGILQLYGAFGRVRYQCRIARHRFYYFGNGPIGLGIEAKDGRIRRFALGLCRNRYALMRVLSAVESNERFRQERQRVYQHLAQTRPAYQYGLLKAYVWLLLLPCAALGFVQLITAPFSNLQALDTAWHLGYILAFVMLLPLAVSCRRSFRFFRWLNLPAHHYWRKSRWGNRAAEALYALRYLLLMAVLMVGYSVFATFNLAWLSLLDAPYQSSEAYLQVKNQQICGYGRYRAATWKITVSMPAQLQQFDGSWCSPIDKRNPVPPEGVYPVWTRESDLARELLFSPPADW